MCHTVTRGRAQRAFCVRARHVTDSVTDPRTTEIPKSGGAVIKATVRTTLAHVGERRRKATVYRDLGDHATRGHTVAHVGPAMIAYVSPRVSL